MISAFEQYFSALRGKRVAVLGLGVSNRPLVRLLLEYGAVVSGGDRTPREKLDEEVLQLERLGCELHLGERFYEDMQAEYAFRTPGMHPENPAVRHLRDGGAEITSEMAAFFAVCPCRMIAITGSDGKTTTTTLISEMLKAAGKTVWLGGNIGTPLLPLTRQMKSDDVAVVELSSFQLMDMKQSPHRAVVTNLSPNHLDVHKDMQEYVDAKKNIFLHQSADDLLILNGDNAITASFRGNGTTRFFSRQGSGYVDLRQGYICRDGKPVVATQDILLPGVHNIENYMAAIAAVEGLVPDEAISQVAQNFGGVEHRIELVRIKDGVRFYNDSIASSPTRTIAGLRSFKDKVILIAGGYDKHIPYDELGPEICEHVKKLFLCGATAPQIRAAVEACPGEKPEMTDCGNFENAVRCAAAAAQQGDVVLMSPASASFDEFKNFMVRGECFKKIIKEL
ncbi:MAG: UDP-N-acetylmuramoyl-L-alanine--D-glutamate ligase [Oscillospiraceae bacterium]|nr:UDP-N-acetylmuramoyl-L-alanine--D-glutamate ligase [Oscillospiraceae bacterium]